MINTFNNKSAYDMLYLVSCILNESAPDKEKINSINLEELFKVCQLHSLTAMVCMALELSDVKIPACWTEEKLKSIRKILLFDSERQKILDYMEKKGIWYLPLKGIILKELYPKIGMRQMADNDILYDKTFRSELNDYMLSQGYKTEFVGEIQHDTYLKPPVFNFEMHTTLLNEGDNENIFAYYSNIKDRLLKDNKKNYAYYFSDEDYYIYITVHEYKHFTAAGTGLRSLADRFVYLKSKQNNLDWNYIESELDKLGISEFEKQARHLCLTIFSGCELPVLSEDESELLKYYLSSGTYGSMENRVKMNIKKLGSDSKLKYIMSRIFPPLKFYKQYFPFFYKHKLLLPVGWMYRIIRVLFTKRKTVNSELKNLKKY